MATKNFNFARLSNERIRLFAERGFPTGAFVLTIGPLAIVLRSGKKIMNVGDGSEELADAPVLNEKFLVQA